MAIVAVCRLAILKRMPAPLVALTLFLGPKKTAHRGRERVAVQNEEAIKRKILQIQGKTELTLDKDFVLVHDTLIPNAIATLKVHKMS